MPVPTPEFDNEASLREAEARMPLERVIRELDFGPRNENWKSFDCPFCKKEDKAGVFTATGSGTKLFKCLSASCEANTAMNVVKFLKKIRGLNSDREAFIEYLKMAGVWRESLRAATPTVENSPQVTNGDGHSALREFYSKLGLLHCDARKLFEKRGLTLGTSVTLGFKSNSRQNRRLLLELAKTFAWEELKMSGLWLPGQQQKCRRPNAQFCGYVQLARKPRDQRKHPDDKTIWGWCDEGWCAKCGHVCKGIVADSHSVCPECSGRLKIADAVLIPYFNERGELIALRPHKGGAPEGTTASAMHLYVPRAVSKPSEENYPLVVITEGEFKAAALWQTLGVGRDDGQEPIGVAAFPGIYFARHLAIRAELDEWLRAVKCRRVIVAYDFEDKGNPKFRGAYQPDWHRRFDAQIWARYLATTLSQRLHIRGETCVLPRDWQNQNGKADWDGALATFVAQPESGVAA